MHPHSALRTPHSFDRKRGQTLIFMALVVVMVAFAALFYFDVNKILHVKALSRNGGDAAALAGARWQAISLNLVGSLNVAQAAALTEALSAGRPSSPESDLISDLQHRIAFSGPMLGYISAQQAAKKNGLHNRDEFASTLQSHIDLLRNEYGLIYPQPFQPAFPHATAWEEVADMYSLAAEHGVAVQPAWQYYTSYANYDHLLLRPEFYDAVAGRSWCWFYWNAFDELQNYANYTDWDDLPEIRQDPPVNSEVLSLHLRRVRVRDSVPTLPAGSGWASDMEALQEALDTLAADDPDTVQEVNVGWTYYSSRYWTDWSSRIPDGFPWDGEIRPEYDFAGADAAMMVEAVAERHTEFHGADRVEWTAGAKPFGSLENGLPPNAVGLVLPAFSDIRLIPIDTTLSGGNSQLRPGWIEFIMLILPQYLAHGPTVLPPGNWFAQQLLTWENPDFRETGVDWLLDYSDTCIQPPPGGGPGSTGGTWHGH